MTRFIFKRLIISFIMMFAVATIVFLSVHLIPGDPVLIMLGSDTNPDPLVVSTMRKEMGLDKPILVQYKDWVIGVLNGNLGKSYSEKIPVVDSIKTRLPRTLELAGASMLLACLIGLPLGVASALKRGKLSDLLMTIVASLGTSIPVYVMGYLFIIIFSLDGFNLGFKLPSSGYVDITKNISAHFLRLILPALTLALGIAASIMRMTRSSMLDAISAESIRALRARGLSERSVIIYHVIRNAFIPVITVIGLQFGNLIGGTVLCETVFNWPGLSTLLVKAINQRDYPLIQGCILIMSSVFIIANTIVDLLYGLLDPRVR